MREHLRLPGTSECPALPVIYPYMNFPSRTRMLYPDGTDTGAPAFTRDFGVPGPPGYLSLDHSKPL